MEIWKTAPGFSAYAVSSLGRLKRIKTPSGKPYNLIIRPHVKRTGYLDYWLWSEGVKTRVKAHALVYETFVGPIPDGLCINHKNGVKDDNRLANLEAVTRSENTKHAFRSLGRKAPNNPSFGEKNGSAKLNPDKVREIRMLCAHGVYQYEVARMFGISQGAVNFIVKRQNWAHVE